MDDLPETSSQFRGLLRAQINEKIDKKTDQIFQERAFGLRRPHNFSIPLAFFLQKNVRNWRFAWDVLTILQTDTVVESIVTFQKRTFGLRRPHNFAFKFVKKMINSLYFFGGKRAFGLSLTISRSLRRFFFQKKKAKIADWLETSS